ncbi:MAG: HDIG domain-containing protein [Bacilli bacterium]|nr:HDIG domain-containing protein [Bacilli bacterium]
MSEALLENVYIDCIEYSKKIKNPILRECCQEIYKDYKEKLMSCPASMHHHHYKGGLLFHSYSVTRNALVTAQLYPHLHIDLDLVIFGSLLHDIGKAKDYFDENAHISMERKNNSMELLGHSYIGTHIVETYLEKYELPIHFKNQVLHMIGSHMKNISEYGALVAPKMFEILLINYSDTIDANVDKILKGIEFAPKGSLYQSSSHELEYYKSLNEYYDK